MAQLSRDPQWRKSRHSAPTGENCVEVANLGDDGTDVGVRDSKAPVANLQFSPAEWQVFTERVRRSEYDL
jgi:hypothetical protein